MKYAQRRIYVSFIISITIQLKPKKYNKNTAGHLVPADFQLFII